MTVNVMRLETDRFVQDHPIGDEEKEPLVGRKGRPQTRRRAVAQPHPIRELVRRLIKEDDLIGPDTGNKDVGLLLSEKRGRNERSPEKYEKDSNRHGSSLRGRSGQEFFQS